MLLRQCLSQCVKIQIVLGTCSRTDRREEIWYCNFPRLSGLSPKRRVALRSDKRVKDLTEFSLDQGDGNDYHNVYYLDSRLCLFFWWSFHPSVVRAVAQWMIFRNHLIQWNHSVELPKGGKVWSRYVSVGSYPQCPCCVPSIRASLPGCLLGLLRSKVPTVPQSNGVESGTLLSTAVLHLDLITAPVF